MVSTLKRTGGKRRDGLTVNESQAALMAGRRKVEQAVTVRMLTEEQKRRKREIEADVYLFLTTYFAASFYQEFTPQRREMVDAILHASKHGGDQSIAAPRGEGKTTIVECVTIFCINLGILKFPLICAATGPDATRILENIKRHYEDNEPLAELYPEICDPIQGLERSSMKARKQTVDGQFTDMRWEKDRIVFPKLPAKYESRACGTVLQTRGLDAAIRGIRYGILRPDLVIIDDPETRESAKSDLQIETRTKTIEQDIGGLGGPGRKLSRLLLCTIMNRQCVAYQYTDRNVKPSWNGKRYKLLEIEPAHADHWEEYMLLRQAGMTEGDTEGKQAREYYANNRALMDEGAIVANPYNFVAPSEVSTLQHCYNIIADRGLEAFQTEYQNDPPEDEGPQESGITASIVMQRLSGLERCIVPVDTACITAGLDLGKTACHWVTVAWNGNASGSVIDYGVQEVYARDRDDSKAVEHALISAMHELRQYFLTNPYHDSEGEVHDVRSCLVDSGYYAGAVYQFCTETGQKVYRPSKGMATLAMPRKSDPKTRLGDNCCMKLQPGGVWLVEMDSDHWKRWLHERFMTPEDKPGSLTLFGRERRDHVSFAHHIVAEVEVEEFVREKGLKRYWKVVNRNNHWLDATYQACVAGSLCGVKLMGHKGAAGRPRAARMARSDRLIQRPGGWLQGMR